MNTVKKFEAKQLEKLQGQKQIPTFNAGDTVKVNVRVKEGTRERIQAYEGVCIARKGSGINETFTVRKISYGEGVERVFPVWSSRIESIELVRRGSVRRAKLYYLRDRRGKSARIAERTSGHGLDDSAPANAAQAAEVEAAKKAKEDTAKDAPQKEEKKAKKEKAPDKKAEKAKDKPKKEDKAEAKPEDAKAKDEKPAKDKKSEKEKSEEKED